MDYKHCFMSHRQQPNQQTLANYIDAHNAYVQQLHATNAMLEAYHCETIPQLMQELEEVYADICLVVSDSMFRGADAISSKVNMTGLNIFLWINESIESILGKRPIAPIRQFNDSMQSRITAGGFELFCKNFATRIATESS